MRRRRVEIGPRIIAAAVLLSGFWAGSAYAEDLLIKAAKVHGVVGEAQALAPGSVLVRGGKIAAVGKDVAIPAGVTPRVIDLGSGELMPGMVDLQQQGGLEGGISEYTREATPSFSAADALDVRSRAWEESLRTGATCLTVLPGTDNVFAGLACVVKPTGGPNGGPRLITRDQALVVTAASDPQFRNQARSRPDSIYVRIPTNRMGVVWILRETFYYAKNTPKGTAPPLKSLRQEMPVRDWDVVRKALAGELPVWSYSRTAYDTTAILRIGGEFGFKPVIAGGEEAYRILDELKAAGTTIILDRQGFKGRDPQREETDTVWAQAAVLDRAGIPFAISEGDLLEQARFAVRFGLPRQKALEAVTLAPARVLGLDKSLGAIAPGRDADLVALDGDPLEFTTSLLWTSVDGVISNTVFPAPAPKAEAKPAAPKPAAAPAPAPAPKPAPAPVTAPKPKAGA